MMTLPPYPAVSDLWTHLREQSDAGIPILLYGMGNGADKILSELEKRGIRHSDVFASDGFVRGHSFHGKRVLSYSEAKEKYGHFTVLLAFGSSLTDVIAQIEKVAREQELYAPDVPVSGGDVFDLSFYNANYEKIRQADEMWEDETSRQIYRAVLYYKLTGKIDCLLDAPEDEGDNLFNYPSFRVCVDAGAYRGETSAELLERCPALERVYAIEPDVKNYRKVEAFAATNHAVIPVHAGVWNNDDTGAFSEQGNRNSAFLTEGGVLTNRRRIDTILTNDTADYLKFDVEGCEREALDGARETILRSLPSLKISVYHRSEDLFALPLQLRSVSRDYAFYLRRKRYIPAWDITLCAKKRMK